MEPNKVLTKYYNIINEVIVADKIYFSTVNDDHLQLTKW